MRNWFSGLLAGAALLSGLACGGGGGATATRNPPPMTYTVTFLAGTGGTLTGSASQTVPAGGAATAVTAVPDTGYVFADWTGSGFTTATAAQLTVADVNSDLTITANFAPQGFTLGLTQPAIQVTRGQTSGPLVITINRLNGFQDPVSLALTNPPTGVTATFVPNPVAGTTCSLTLSTDTTASAGSSLLTLAGASANLVQSAAFTLTVAALRWDAQYTEVFSDNVETPGTGISAGLQLLSQASVTSDPAQVIDGGSSILLGPGGSLATVAANVPFATGSTYLVQFSYKVLNAGAGPGYLGLSFQPPGDPDPYHWLPMVNPTSAAPLAGTYSAGMFIGPSGPWELHLMANPDATLVIDDLVILEQAPVASASMPARWATLGSIPFPRLGMYQLGTLDLVVDQIAFFDVVAGPALYTQTANPDWVHRLRLLNPQVVLLPYRLSEEQSVNTPAPPGQVVDLDYNFQQSIPDPWFVRDTLGNYVEEGDFSGLHAMNISPFCPVVAGQTWTTAEVAWLTGTVLPSGLWDGIFFDNLFGRMNGHFPNSGTPTLLNYDWNRNGLRDETLASSSDMTRAGAEAMLGLLGSRIGTSQLVMGNNGSLPDLYLAPLVNGYVFEGANYAWQDPTMAQASEGRWRQSFDAYRAVQASTLPPRLNVIMGTGFYNQGDPPRALDALDIAQHRFCMGTALLDDGFYEYAVQGNTGPVNWMDEFSVDATGTANMNMAYKGYLGQPLGACVELASPATTIWQADFEDGTVPAAFNVNQPITATISTSPAQTISGAHSLLISNPDPAQLSPGFLSTASVRVPLGTPGTYQISFDWKVIQTLDTFFDVAVVGSAGATDGFQIPGVVAGDAGHSTFPVTLAGGAGTALEFALWQGLGLVAIDNIQVALGGPGPWRRDFEHGFVLVNPLLTPHTFSLQDLQGSYGRTGIRRILGTQAPAVNNGQAVTTPFTLAPFDAIILLADPIAAK